ncbi:hypothetical protein TcCL_ESM03238 [Trypanosoma cruzi]|nr:hypothetical protein TcCL_ESM03238 [Trypanosoma cruzi]
MAASQGGPDAVHDTKAEADHVAALRPPAIKRVRKLLVLVVRKWSGELAGRQQSRRRFSFTRVGIAQQAAATCAHGIHNKGNKEARRHSNTGKRVHVDCTFRLAHRHPDGGRAAALRCVWRVTAVDRGDDERGGRRSAALIHLG